jgi:hypothetical protein
MSYLIAVYIAYATIAVALIVWIQRTLFRNGAVFLQDVFNDTPKLAESVNHLLVVGFYLLNLGYAALTLQADPAASVVQAIEILSWKLGVLLVTLGIIHFCNMYLFYRIRRRARLRSAPPPVAPQFHVAPQQAGASWTG